MPPELAVKAITHTVIAIQIITILVVLLIALRKEIEGGDPVRGIVHFGIAVMALCTFLALMVALFSAKKMAIREKFSQRLETANWNPHL
jgi:hypothetical protein